MPKPEPKRTAAPEEMPARTPNRAPDRHPADPTGVADQQRHQGGTESSHLATAGAGRQRGGTHATQPDAEVKIGPRVPRGLARELKLAAAAHGRTEQAIVIEALRQWLDAHPWQQ